MVKKKKAHFMVSPESRRLGILRVLLNSRNGIHAKEIYGHVETLMAWGTCLHHLNELKDEGTLERELKGRKTVYRLTKEGRDFCARLQIKEEVGLLDFDWANRLFREGYRVRFLSDLTGNEGQKRWLFAWNPKTRDIKYALFFGMKEVPKDGYTAQYVDRSKKADAPITKTTLQDFVNNNVSDFENEEEIAAALRKFYDVETHNCFICIITPTEEVRFGFPSELGHFDSYIIVGVGRQEIFPFIPKITMSVGGLSLSKNLRILTYHELNFLAWHDASWLLLRETIGETVNPDLIRFLLARSSNFPTPTMECAHYFKGECEKLDGIRCEIAGDMRRLLECPILPLLLKSDLKQPYTSIEAIYNRWKKEFDDWLAHPEKLEVTHI